MTVDDCIKIIEWIKKNWYEPISLLFSIPIAFYISFRGISAIFNVTWLENFLVGAIGSFILVLIWLLSSRTPKKGKNKIGVVIAIRDNTEEARKVRYDVIDKFQEIMVELPSGSIIELLPLKDVQARKVTNEKSATQMSNKTKAQFIIWGKSMSYAEKYKFDLHFIVRHRQLNLQEKKVVSKGFTESLVNKNWEFLEKDIFTGIVTTAQNIREIALYVMGIAAHLSYDFDTCLKLHGDLYEILKRDKDKREELRVVNARLPYWLSSTYIILGWQQYFAKNLNRAIELNRRSMDLQPFNYSAMLNMALYAFQNGDISTAKKIIKSIKKTNKKANLPDSAWRYSEGFLTLLEGKFESGLKIYQKAIAGYVTEFTISSVIAFLNDFLEKNSDKKQFIFILGLIYQKKKDNLPMAMKEFEKFLNETKNDPVFGIFREEAKRLLREIYKILELDDVSSTFG